MSAQTLGMGHICELNIVELMNCGYLLEVYEILTHRARWQVAVAPDWHSSTSGFGEFFEWADSSSYPLYKPGCISGWCFGILF